MNANRLQTFTHQSPIGHWSVSVWQTDPRLAENAGALPFQLGLGRVDIRHFEADVMLPAGRIPGVPGDTSQLERCAVVVRRVAAAMAHNHGMLERYLVEIADVQLSPVLHFGVVEEVALDPRAGRGR